MQKRNLRWSTGLLAMSLCAACSAPGDEGSSGDFAELNQELVANGVNVQLSLQSDWGAGYCANVSLHNASAKLVTSWSVVIELNQSQLSNAWSSTTSVSGTRLTATPAGFNATLAPNASTSFGFCATSTGTNYRPFITAASITGGDTGGGTAGSGGGGSGGTAGSGGGGSGGTAGSGGGGSGGTAGKGGSGGSGGSSGGTAGSAGAAGSSGSGGGGACQKPSAPSNFQQTIDLTWKEMTGGLNGKPAARPPSAGVQNFKNAVLDQVMESGGTLNFCVRYESNVVVTAAQRDKVAVALQRGVDEWFAKVKGHDCFPLDKVTTKVTGWATVNRSTLDWPDGVVPLYINQIGNENVAQCPNVCSRFARYHSGQSTKGYTYPGCSGGAANRFDMHLWLTEGFQGGAGGDWGQRVGRAYFMNSLDSAHQHIWLHEFGHGFGFPDYYEWESWAPGVARPHSVMVAGLSQQVTDWDGWMLRHTWSSLKARWQ